jgi:tetratricopeptide (TPR) repeat protein
MEEPTCTRLVEIAQAAGDDETCWKLAYALRDRFFRATSRDVWIHSHTVALRAARQSGDRWAVATTLNNLGLGYAMSRRLGEADEQYAEALRLFRDLGDRYGQATRLGHLAWTAYHRGDYLASVAQATEALAIYRQFGARRNVGITLRTLALAEAAAGGSVARAVTHLTQALNLFVADGLSLDEAMALNCLGEVTLAGDARTALRWHGRAWRRARAAGSRFEQARALRGMAAAAVALGRFAAAEGLRARAETMEGGG